MIRGLFLALFRDNDMPLTVVFRLFRGTNDS